MQEIITSFAPCAILFGTERKGEGRGQGQRGAGGGRGVGSRVGGKGGILAAHRPEGTAKHRPVGGQIEKVALGPPLVLQTSRSNPAGLEGLQDQVLLHVRCPSNIVLDIAVLGVGDAELRHVEAEVLREGRVGGVNHRGESVVHLPDEELRILLGLDSIQLLLHSVVSKDLLDQELALARIVDRHAHE